MKEKIIMIVQLILLGLFVSYITYAVFIDNEEAPIEIEQAKVYASEVVEDECVEEYEDENVAVVSSNEPKVSANAILILKKYYNKCEHTINEYVELPQELVNMTEKEVQEEYTDWEVIGFEEGKVTFYKEFDGTCGEHFKLKVENGKVIIYLVNEDSSETVYEKTEISSEYLTETDLINMQDNGLEIFGKEELNKIIEDFE